MWEIKPRFDDGWTTDEDVEKARERAWYSQQNILADHYYATKDAEAFIARRSKIGFE